MRILKLNGLNKVLPVLVLALVLVAGCYKDNAEKLYPGPVGGISCDTLSMKYSVNVQPLLTANCATAGCHTASNKPAAGGYAFDSHAETLVAVNNGRLLKSIKWVSGVSAMPKGGGKLGDCDINKIGAWINQGALNN